MGVLDVIFIDGLLDERDRVCDVRPGRSCALFEHDILAGGTECIYCVDGHEGGFRGTASRWSAREYEPRRRHVRGAHRDASASSLHQGQPSAWA